MKTLAFAAYIACVVAANWLTHRYHVVPVGFGLDAAAGTFTAGLALAARDFLQDAAGKKAVLVAIPIGAAVSVPTSSLRLGVASGAAFLLAEMLDMYVYSRERKKGWARAILTSNAFGAVLDTFVFLLLAGIPVGFTVVTGQLVVKYAYATVPVVLFVLAVQKVQRARRQPAEAVAA